MDSSMQAEREQIRQAIAQRVEATRVASEITQRELAERLGMSLGAVSQRLQGHRAWRADELVRVADCLNVRLSTLYRDVVTAWMLS